MKETENIGTGSAVKNTTVPENAIIYKYCKVENSNLGEHSVIGDNSEVIDCSLENRARLQRRAICYSSTMGRYTFTGRDFRMFHSDIGAFCSIAWNVSIGSPEHDMERCTMSAITYADSFGLLEGHEPFYSLFHDKRTTIGNDVWIGAGVIILQGVSIGDGAVIGAGAVVTEDVAQYTVVAGVPARTIKKRFDDDIIEKLLEARWWDFPEHILKDHIELLGAKMDTKVADELLKIRKEMNG